MINSRELKQAKSTLKLTRQQRHVLIGVLLGDAHLESDTSGQTFRLKIEQSVRHAAYVEHLYELFSDWVTTNPRARTRQAIGRNPTTSIGFQTLRHGVFRFYFHQFYRQGKKCVPKLIHRWLTPQAIAYWLMDDGSIKSKQSKGILFNTHGFCRGDVERLAKVLADKFSLSTSLRKQQDGIQIYVSGESYPTFVDLVEKYLTPDMRYKLPPPRR